MLRFAVIALLGLLVCSSYSSAQIIYEPAQYQYGAQRPYYYGGNDPAIHRAAQAPTDTSGHWGRVNGYAFASGNIDTHREVSSEHPRTFNDALGTQDASIYGYTANDAHNDANANEPRYFRKADLLASAIPQADGTLIVPAQSSPQPPRVIVPVVKPLPTTEPQPILIIPKKLLEQRPSDNKVASAK